MNFNACENFIAYINMHFVLKLLVYVGTLANRILTYESNAVVFSRE